jgi:hypothetical protein
MRQYMFVRSHYFPPDNKPEFINYFHYLENNLDKEKKVKLSL